MLRLELLREVGSDRAAAAEATDAGGGAVAGISLQRGYARLTERIAHGPRHHFGEIHDHHAHAELDFAGTLERLLGALGRDASAAVGFVTQRRHDAENEQRDHDLDQGEAGAARAQDRPSSKGGHGVVWPWGVVIPLFGIV